MAEGGNGGSRRSRPDLDDQPVKKALHGACDSDTDTDDIYEDAYDTIHPDHSRGTVAQRSADYDTIPSDHSRGTVAQRSADWESGSWIQVPESTVPSIPGEPYHSPVGPPSYVQVNDSEGVHVGSVIQYHFHRQGIEESGRAVPPETQGDFAPLSSVASQINAKETQIRGESDNYSSGCRKKTGNFVETTLYYLAKKEIGEKKTVLLLGGMGDGKSSIIQYIAANPMEDYFPVPCASPKEIQRYLKLAQGTDIKLLFVLDDPVGGSYTQQKLLDKWVHIMGNLEMCLTQNQHKFIFAMRQTVWSDCEVHLGKSPFFCNKINVTSVNLIHDDKVMMLEKYPGNLEKLSGWDKHRIVTECKPIAFGQCCKLMGAAIGLSSAELVLIFEKPFSYLLSELKKMADKEKEKYAVLCIVMLCGNNLECKQLRGTMSDVKSDVKERIGVVVDVCNRAHLTCGVLQESADKLTGTHLEKLQATDEDSGSCEVYKFAHDSIHESVTMYYGQLHPSHCLKYLNSDVVVNIARPHNHEKREQEFAINFPSENYIELAEVFTTKVINENGKIFLGQVFDNPCVKDEQFQSAWVDYLRNSSPDKLSDFRQSKAPYNDRCVLYFLAISGGHTLLSFLCPDRQSECKCSGSLPCVLAGAIEGNQAESVSWYLSSRTLTRGEVSTAVFQACHSDRADVLRPLFTQTHRDHHAEMVSEGLWTVGRNGHVRSAEYLVTHCCQNPCIGPRCLCWWGLRSASMEGQTDIVRLIINSHGQNMKTAVNDYNGDTCLHEAAEWGRIDVVKFLVSNGADVNAKNGKGKTSLDLAVETTLYECKDVVKFLQSNGGQHGDQ